jgi:hypothetical protein
MSPQMFLQRAMAMGWRRARGWLSEENDLERANRIAERIKTNPKVAQIVSDAQAFDHCASTPAGSGSTSTSSAASNGGCSRSSTGSWGRRRTGPSRRRSRTTRASTREPCSCSHIPSTQKQNLERAARMAWAMTYEDEPLGG